MKFTFFLLAFLTMPILYAQTDQFNLEKYWKFRNDLVRADALKIIDADSQSIKN